MKRAILPTLLVVLLAASLSGCWSRRELSGVAFASIMGIDWVDDQYLVTINAITPKHGAQPETGEREIWTISEQGRAIEEALTKIDQILSRAMTLAHVRSVVFGEEMARRGIGPPLDILLRRAGIRPTVWLTVTIGSAADLLRARPRQEANLARDPLGQQDFALRRSSLVPTWHLVEVANMLQEEGIDLTLPLFYRGDIEVPAEVRSVEPNPEHAAEVVFGGAGVFKDDRLVRWIGPEVSRGQSWAIDRTVHGSIVAPCDGERHSAVFRLRKATGQVKTRAVGGKISAEIAVEVFADLNELDCPDLTQPNGTDRGTIQDLLAEAVTKEIEGAVAVMRESGSDFLGLGQSLFRQDPMSFKRYEENWPNMLSEMPVKIQVEATVPRLGQINSQYRWERTN